MDRCKLVSKVIRRIIFSPPYANNHFIDECVHFVQNHVPRFITVYITMSEFCSPVPLNIANNVLTVIVFPHAHIKDFFEEFDDISDTSVESAWGSRLKVLVGAWYQKLQEDKAGFAVGIIQLKPVGVNKRTQNEDHKLLPQGEMLGKRFVG